LDETTLGAVRNILGGALREQAGEETLPAAEVKVPSQETPPTNKLPGGSTVGAPEEIEETIDLSEHQLGALQAFKTIWGSGWQKKLKEAWESGEYGDIEENLRVALEEVKTLVGPDKLGKIKLEEPVEPEVSPRAPLRQGEVRDIFGVPTEEDVKVNIRQEPSGEAGVEVSVTGEEGEERAELGTELPPEPGLDELPPEPELEPGELPFEEPLGGEEEGVPESRFIEEQGLGRRGGPRTARRRRVAEREQEPRMRCKECEAVFTPGGSRANPRCPECGSKYLEVLSGRGAAMRAMGMKPKLGRMPRSESVFSAGDDICDFAVEHGVRPAIRKLIEQMDTQE
jgi:hypothetical protein